MRMSLVMIVVIAAIAACAPAPVEDAGPADAGAAIADAGSAPPPADAGFVEILDAGPCSSGRFWSYGLTPSPEMKPGSRCITCHRTTEGAPRFLIAGTVHGALDDADDCYGVPGVVVRIEAQDGGVVETTTNAAGNFYVPVDGGPRLRPPYTARLLYEGRERPMIEAQDMFDCTTCHTARGGGGAPGRIIAP